jgi:AraC family transcriptional regulator
MASDVTLREDMSKLPVTEIAFQAGYESHEAFTRAFKASYGVAPARFRSTRSLIPPRAAPSGVHFSANKPPRNFKAKRSRMDNMNVQIKTLAPLRVAFMRHVDPYDKVGETWDKLLVFVGKEGLIGGDSLFIGICHDDPEVTPPGRIRYDACVTVDDTFKPVGDVGVQTVAGGDYAVTTHFGPYAQLGASYAKLFGQWLPRSGRQLHSTPCFEVYLNSPENTDPNELLTDIHMPLQPAGSLNPNKNSQ